MFRITAPARPLIAAALSLSALCAAPLAQAAGTAQVNYIAPEKFSDIGVTVYERETTLRTMTDYLQRLAKDLLPDGQSLSLDVTDINLAGEIPPAGRQQVRLLRGTADWPQMQFSYKLQQDGKLLKSGDAKLADMNYMLSLRPSQAAVGDLPYEKRMVRKWFETTLLAH